MSTTLPLVLSSTMSTSPSLQNKTIFYLSPGRNGHEGSSQMLQQDSAWVSTSAILRLRRRSYLILSYLILVQTQFSLWIHSNVVSECIDEKSVSTADADSLNTVSDSWKIIAHVQR